MRIRMGKLTDCFLAGYTKDGYKSYFSQEISAMKQMICLKGAGAEIRSRLYKAVAHNLAEDGIDIELVHQACNANLLEGLILPKEKVILADEAAIDSTMQMIIFDLTEYLNQENYAVYEAKINDLEEQIRINTELLHENCCNKNSYPQQMASRKSKEKIVSELADKYFFKNKAVTHIRFAKGIDIEQKDDYYTEVLNNIAHKHYLPSEWDAKNAILVDLAQLATKLGYENTIYYNNWDSENIELLLIPQLNLALAAEKIKDDFVCCLKNTGVNENLPENIAQIVANMKHLTATLTDIYSDILAEEELFKAENNLKQIVLNCLDNQSEK